MDLPVDEWKSYLLEKWSLLPISVRLAISTAKTLSDVFLLSSSLLQPEDEIFLKRLSRGYLVGKDPGAPLFYREEGNKKFQEKDYAGAAVLYSKGVSHSKPNTEDISLCYANRSAALFHLGQYETCLKDIIKAQTHGYPERLQPKIMLRKAECLVTMGRLQEASQTISDLESNFTAKPALADSPFQSLQRNLHHLKMKIQEKKNLTETFPAALAKAFEDMDLREENEQISSASSSVTLCTDPLKGRYLIATKDILPGELLVKEAAFVSVLNPGEVQPLHQALDSKWSTRVTNGDLYCHQCLKHTLATVPCDGCSYAKYCSQECMQQAWELYHRIECSLGGLLLTLGVFCHIALRLTLLARFEDAGEIIRKLCDETSHKDIYLPESKNMVKTLNYGQGESEENGNIVQTPIPGCDVNGKYENNYYAVFNLLPHTENHSPEHKFLCALSVSALCRQLEAASLQALTTNLESSKLKAAVTPEFCSDLDIWGVAMLRHMLQLQCNAQAITTIQHIGSKENIITDSRQVRLATGIFPVVSLLNHSCSPNTSVSFISNVATIRASQQIGKGQEILHCYEPAIRRLLGCRHDAESFLSAEHTMVGEIEDDLAQAYAALGDWQKSATHLQRSLQVVEVRHGPCSVEMGHELFKLAQIFFSGFAISEALNTIEKAEKVLLVHYGPWHDDIQELQKMKSCLLDLPPIPVGPSM
ncbi:protein-lysine N-methyltransferase SMYD4 isoform X3 [Microcebus murinus]|uniref:protein-lysine N-methyltransferase SMYD4 isoform X3 n=1 Tax=Microcebus murinus TaxID=30608 RepID=UPI003F6A9912